MPQRARGRGLHWIGDGRVIAVYSVILTAFFFYYAWQCTHEDGSHFLDDGYSGAYGELADAFLHGQTYLLIKPDAKLDLVADPYDPAKRGNAPFLWDYSYYRAPHALHGKWFLYFGAPPALLLFCPWKLMTGHMPSVYLVFLFISLINIILFAALIRLWIWHHFPRAPLFLQSALLVTYGCCNLFPYLQCTPEIYDIAIGFAVTSTLACFVFLFCALQSDSKRNLWLILASTCAGLAFASRPSDVLLYAILVIVGCYLAKLENFPREKLKPSFLYQILCLFMPASLGGLAVAWYNETRFGSPWEFGLHYQLNNVNFSQLPPNQIAYLVNGFWCYFLTPWHPSTQFPYIDPDPWIDLPGGWLRGALETHVGLWTVFPFLLLSAGWLFYFWKGKLQFQESLGVFGLMVSTWALGIATFLMSWPSISFRYETEIVMPLLLLASLTLLLRCQLGPFSSWQTVLQVFLFAFSCYMGIALGLFGNERWINSIGGLTMLMNTQEELGRYDLAEEYGLEIKNKLGENMPLLHFYEKRSQDGDKSSKVKYLTLFRQVFPLGLRNVTISSLAGPPETGMKFAYTSDLMARNGISDTQIVVGLDRFLVQNAEQFRYVRSLSNSPRMALIVWDGHLYHEATVYLPGRLFDTDLLDYHPEK